jgi:hypothetical protein
MPLKTKTRRPHHISHKKEKRTKHFMKVYAPYIPLLIIVGCGIILSSRSEVGSFRGAVKSYATNTTDSGLLSETNKRRAQENLKPLTHSDTLDAAAQAKADDMGKNNYWSHITPDGREPWDFMDKAGYHYSKAAENLAYGFDNSNSTLNGWMNSPGHRANVMDPDLREVGFGMMNVANYQGHGPETIVVAMYGQPVTASGAAAPTDNTPIKTVASAQTKDISYVQSLTAGKAPWSSFIVGLLIGSIIMYLVAKNARSMRRALHKGERFVVHHPLFDITLIALLALAAIASQTIGTIY